MSLTSLIGSLANRLGLDKTTQVTQHSIGATREEPPGHNVVQLTDTAREASVTHVN